jgi:hypothetical protein
MNTIHKGSLIIDRRNMRDFAHITEVTGDLSIRAEGAALPVLQSVGGYLYIEAEGAALPVLQSVGCDLYIEAEGAALPVLQSVGGYLSIRAEGAALPVLQSVGGYLYIAYGITFDYSRITFGAGEVLAVWEYALHFKDGNYRAGCRGPWDAEQALRHWGAGHHAPSRAKCFTEVIAERIAAVEAV